MSKSDPKALFLLLPVCLIAADKPDSLLELRFSSDGKYVFAQDSEQITVLTAEPFAVSFRIPGAHANSAQFTPDSSSIVFLRSATLAGPDKIAISHGTNTFERWSVTDGKLTASAQLPDIVCGTLVLAPDGRTYACQDYQGTLQVIDVASSKTILEKRKFVGPIFSWIGNYRVDFPSDLGSAGLFFSPDGKILIALGAENRQFSNNSTLILDVWERQPVKAKSALHLIGGAVGFVFLDSTRLLVWGGWPLPLHDAIRARIVTFPAGKCIATAMIRVFATSHRAADASFVIGVPFAVEHTPSSFGSIPVRVPTDVTVAIELATGQMIVSHARTLDVFHDHYVTEVRPGEIGLYERHKGLQSSVVLH